MHSQADKTASRHPAPALSPSDDAGHFHLCWREPQQKGGAARRRRTIHIRTFAHLPELMAALDELRRRDGVHVRGARAVA